jgi:chitinase
MNKILLALILFISIFFTFSLSAAVLFEDNFDSHQDWSPTQPNNNGSSISCTVGDQGCIIPTGYAGWRIQASSYIDHGQNTMSINSTNKRGVSGKGFTFWSEVVNSDWASDGLLDIELDSSGYNEIYVRFYIKFQSGWEWATTESPLQKFLHISHYNSSDPTSRYDFFDLSQNKPRSIIDLAKYNSGTADIAISVLQSRYGTASTEAIDYFGTGNYGGTGDDFWDEGMIGDGEWHCWESYFKMNSADGVADGISRSWVDGVLIHESTNIAWVTGDDPANRRWNYVWIGGNSYNPYDIVANSPEQWYAIDDIVISTTYVGLDYVIGLDETAPISGVSSISGVTFQ